jgi:RecA/RadA recombinase
LRSLQSGAAQADAHDSQVLAALQTVQRAAYEEALRSVRTGTALDACARAYVPLSTGAAVFDRLLCGGLRRGEVTELSGPPASGKTQARAAWLRRPHAN